MKLVIIIPAHNEENTVGDIISNVPHQIEGINQIEVVVINDASSDKTKSVAESAGASVISHVRNLGVGAAFHTGINAALKKKADIIVNIDADGQFNPEDIPVLIKPILKGEASFVTASRFKDPALTPKMPKIKIWGNKRMSQLISFLTGQKFYDVSCGFRAYSKDTALRLSLFGKFTYTQETFLDLANKDVPIKEIPIVVKEERLYGKSSISSNLWKYAAKTSKIIFRSFRDYKPLRFFGLLSLPIFFIGTSLGTFLFIHYLMTGRFSPHKWAGFSGLGLILIGIFLLFLGIVADMLDRIRSNQEEILYYERKREYEKK